jgi:hypothetical protein
MEERGHFMALLLYPQKETLIPIKQEAGWALGTL